MAAHALFAFGCIFAAAAKLLETVVFCSRKSRSSGFNKLSLPRVTIWAWTSLNYTGMITISVRAVCTLLYVLNDFEWYRDQKGYRIVPFRSVRTTAAWKQFEETQPPSNRSDAFDELPWIIPNGEPGDAIRYKPFAGHADLSDAFASVRTPDDLLRFVNNYGALTWQGGRRQTDATSWNFSLAAEPVTAGLADAEMFRELLKFRAMGDPRQLASHFESKIAGFVGGGQAGQVEILPDYERGIRLKVSPPHLRGALWYQLALRLSDATLRMCPACSRVFAVGPGTGKRADAYFCCEEHKIEYFNRPEQRKRRRRKGR